MTASGKRILESFDELPEAEKREVATAILRRALRFDTPPLGAISGYSCGAHNECSWRALRGAGASGISETRSLRRTEFGNHSRGEARQGLSDKEVEPLAEVDDRLQWTIKTTLTDEDRAHGFLGRDQFRQCLVDYWRQSYEMRGL